ncbi:MULTISPECIES: translesion error-prone DNA polymerase V autoproteolytic subunit [Marinobacter]|jgi:DNA polymerase V|uniref:UmuD protein. Serine peptidase. MEROPS family S24 n=4 Tax=root TaxID=1 RepID=A1U8F6_MARN8|nr:MULTISPECIES: translesion error-prone DNA polymerase V autoproteolytic subunit [Marinobacter]ABM21275.1 UmuD protein. Serine peptidase. MEROPS family S24 [Marinobacter nauticus VT8]MBJ7277538.1 translesion error-prone DNA polymerase V autoproteolytic subunit [Marinobacter salarius]MBY5963708.1 translesion error-prone DNA polymerase V autoproteolytic subunit [Marinobacter nauticus]OJS98070.1 DNA polymerase V [Marinobacter nauticus]BEH16669.1 protein impA' [Marinobacter shengliensis]|tara:strand:- start:8762 stop:9190 length:429 start_codon:yes stop_codon:yes gene_type:complete
MLIKQIFRPTEQLRSSIAFFSDAVKAGFPSPAQDYIEKTLSLDDLCIRTPAATYFVRASGSSMERAGIHDGDVLVVDRSLPPGHRKIVIASVDGEFVCKRLDLSVPSRPVLRAESEDYPDITLREEDELEIFGVVTTVVHAL